MEQPVTSTHKQDKKSAANLDIIELKNGMILPAGTRILDWEYRLPERKMYLKVWYDL